MSTGRVDHAALARVMSDYASALVDGGRDVTEMLDQLAERAVTVLDLAGAGIVLSDGDGGFEAVVTTDGRARRMEDDQMGRGDGPCFHAVRSGEVIAVQDLESDDRWPDHHETARAVGYRGVLGVPMPLGDAPDAPIGALNLYDSDPRGWTTEELEAATLLGNMAAGYVVMARSLEDSRVLAEQLQHALETRALVEQAKGMLAAHHGIDVDAAFERLRSHARSNRRRVMDVARDLVEGRVALDGWDADRP